MGNEAIEGSKMGSQLIMFVAIVGLALVAFLVGKNLMNTGLEQMETTVQAVNDSRFSDYNGKTVRGRAVKSAIDSFANDNVAIFIHTLAMGDDATMLYSVHEGDDWHEKANGNSCAYDSAEVWTITSGNGAELSVDSNDGGVLNGTAYYVNYGAMLSTEGNFSFDGKVQFDRDFSLTESGNVRYNANGTNLRKQGTAEYVADSASFNAQLIKNTSGETIGIIFYQKKTY